MKFFILFLAFLHAVNGTPTTINIDDEVNAVNSIAETFPTNVADKSENIQSRDIIGTILDTLACRTTSQYGYNGRCVPRQCCRGRNGVDNLCSQSDFVCCYSEDRCRDADFPIYVPHYPNDGSREWCNRVVTRYDWEALPALERPRPLRGLADKVIVHHTGRDTHRCDSPRSCGDFLRYIQEIYQRRRGFPDIAWNFIINEYGEVFEGVGWGFEGYHTAGKNYDSLGVAFVGDFERYYPTRSAIRAFESLMDCGIKHGFLRRNYGIWGHSDFNPSTDCPGRNLYRELTHMVYFNTNLIGRDGNEIVQLNGTLFNDSNV